MWSLFSFSDIGRVLGIIALSLLIASEMLSVYKKQSDFVVEKRVLKIFGLLFGHAFIITVVIRALQIIR
jgi:hypothetical protein